MFDKPEPCWCRRAAPARSRSASIFAGACCATLDEAALRETVRALAAERVESIAVCLLFSFLHPEHEARVRDDHRGGDAGLQRVAVLRDPAADPRVLPADHHGHQRLPAADPGALHRTARCAPDRGTHHDAAEIHHAVERRHVDLRGGGPQGGDDGAVGAGRRRHGGRLCVPHDRLSEPHHLRHGRHVLRRRADPDGEPSVVEPRQDRGTRRRGADDGHQHGERRRRHDRAGRPLRHARGRTAKRRRGAGTGLLRPRRRRSRPSPTAIWCSGFSARTISSAAGCGSTRRRRAPRSRRAIAAAA